MRRSLNTPLLSSTSWLFLAMMPYLHFLVIWAFQVRVVALENFMRNLQLEGKAKFQWLTVVNGWVVYNPQREFARLGLHNSNAWRISEANINYEICDTYPRYLVVPKRISDEQLAAAAQFRSRGIPA